MDKINKILEMIKRNDSIVIYRHIHPDFDAYGSQLGLKYLILENFPDKNVYTAGFDKIEDNEFVEEMDNPDIETVRNSLVIAVDTSTFNRIDGNFYSEGKESIMIDHHQASELYADVNYVLEDICSCTVAVTGIFRSMNLKFNSKAASYLVAGIYTDSCGLTTDAVNSETFDTLSFLVGFGINLVEINQYCYADSIEEFKAKQYVSSKIVFEKDSAYIIIKQEDMAKFNLPSAKYNEMIDVMSAIKGVNRYSFFTEMEKDQYRCSLRSHKQPIRNIAVEYGGGGHNMASGVKPLTLKQVYEIITKMRDLQ